MPCTAANIPDLHGRTAVVTGANGGFELSTAKAFAGAGAPVEILAAVPGSSLEVVELDLASLASVEGSSIGWPARLACRPIAGRSPRSAPRPIRRRRVGQLHAPRFVSSGAAVRRLLLRRAGRSTAIATLWAVSERETGLALDIYA